MANTANYLDCLPNLSGHYPSPVVCVRHILDGDRAQNQYVAEVFASQPSMWAKQIRTSEMFQGRGSCRNIVSEIC